MSEITCLTCGGEDSHHSVECYLGNLNPLNDGKPFDSIQALVDAVIESTEKRSAARIAELETKLAEQRDILANYLGNESDDSLALLVEDAIAVIQYLRESKAGLQAQLAEANKTIDAIEHWGRTAFVDRGPYGPWKRFDNVISDYRHNSRKATS